MKKRMSVRKIPPLQLSQELLIETLIKAAEETVHAMLGVKELVVESQKKEVSRGFCGQLGLHGDVEGEVTLTTSQEGMRVFAGKMLCMSEEELDAELLKDSLGELLNVIVGRFHLRLMEQLDIHLGISLPAVKELSDEKKRSNDTVIPCSMEGHPLQLAFAIQDKRKPSV